MPKPKNQPVVPAANPLDEPRSLVGKRLLCESKKAGRDIVDVEITVSNVIQIPDGPMYLFGVSGNGVVGTVNTKFFFVDTIKLEPAVDFKPQPLDGWYMVPPDNGVFDPHFGHTEKVSARAQKRLPVNSLELKAHAIA